MKKIFRKFIQISRSKRALRIRRKRKLWERARNIRQNSRKRIKHRRPRYPQNTFNRSLLRTIEIPKLFNLTSGKQQTLEFFEICKKINSEICTKLHFNCDDVEDIGHGAITILLSICGYLKDQGVNVSGSYPKDPKIRTTFEKAGFLKYFIAHYSRKENIDSPNEILTRGLDKTNSKGSAKQIRGAMKTVWGKEQKNTGMQGLLIELMANTVNHAYDKHQKGWYFAIEHDRDSRKVKFCFVDNGQGILNTVKIKLLDKIDRFVGNSSDIVMLKDAFDGKFGSRTQLSYRGRGLPAIKKNYENRIIKNLVVISNNVCLNFDSNSHEQLTTPFAGTFYYWELDQTCLNRNNGI